MLGMCRTGNTARRLTQSSLRAMSNLVEFNVQGTARTVTLNRANKLNALNTQMCKDVIPRLQEYAKSRAANVIVIKSATERAFCAGGDVVQAAKNNVEGKYAQSLDFFEAEYSLDYLLAVYGKPIVAFANGITMGGGVGLSVHNPFRVVCESTRFAMPESSIGFVNDVGTSFWLPTLDGNLGYYLGLTGEELSGIDTLLAGFGTHYVPASRHQALVDRLSKLELAPLAKSANNTTLFSSNRDLYALVNSTIEEFAQEVPIYHKFKYTPAELDTIEKCFNPDVNKTVEAVIQDLRKDGSAFALKTVAQLEARSPLSVKLNWALLTKSRASSIHEALTRELKIAAKLMTNYKPNDFVQYINHKLIEKSKATPVSALYPTLDTVPSEVVDQIVSLDTYAPDQNAPEGIVETLNGLRIPKFDGVGINNDFIEYPHHMGLPTQAEIHAYVAAGDCSYADTVKYFQFKYNDKTDVSYKVKSVLDRKTKSDGDKLNWL